MYTIPGGFGNTHLEAGATPCNWPSAGKLLPLLPFPQLNKEKIATEAIKKLVLFFIVLYFEGIGKCNDYFELQTFSKSYCKDFS
jgi:hypothetical protein